MNSKLSGEIRRVLRGGSQTTPHGAWTGPGAGSRLARALVAGTLLGLLPPIPAEALQLGPITAHSALNEPLDARVTLTPHDPGEVEQLKVSLAGREHFTRAGIPRDPALGRLRFRVAEDAEGKPLIRVSTHAAFREPVLTFLLEVVSARTHMVREYSVLLDPPIYAAPVRSVATSQPAARSEVSVRAPEPRRAERAPQTPQSAPAEITVAPTGAVNPAAPKGATASGDDGARARREAIAGLARDMARLRERIAARREEGEVISDRLARVEKNISGLREVIARQQQAMEELQARIAAMPPVTSVAAAPAATVPTAEAPATDAPIAEVSPAAPATAVPVLGEAPPAPTAADLQATPVATPASLQSRVQSAVTTYALEALLGLAAVGLLGWALALRARLSRLQESDAQDALADTVPATAAEAGPAEHTLAATGAAETPAFESEGETDMEEDGESSDAIPFSEAAIYHAYGDYDQAESLLKALVEKHPDSEQYRLALLRVLHEARRPDDFQEHASALRGLIADPDASEAWRETMEMSQELNLAPASGSPAASTQGFVKTVVLADRPSLAEADTATPPMAAPEETGRDADLDGAPEDWSVSLEAVPTVDPDDTLVPVATMELPDTGRDALLEVDAEEAAKELADAGLPEPEGDDEETDVLDWADNLFERHANRGDDAVDIEDDELAQSLVLELELEPMDAEQAEAGDLDLTATSNLKASSG